MKIRTYNQYLNLNETQKMSSLRQPSDDEIEWAEKYLEEGKDPDWDYTLGYFFIDISGKYHVYYTLWKQGKLNINFITNLSTDFETAIEKAKKATGRIPVVIDRTGTKAGLFKAAQAEILTFGKYRGKTLGDVFVEDPKYIVWLSKNYDGKSVERAEKIKYYTDLYYETITKKNLEESKSQHIGKIGEKIFVEGTIYDVRKNVSDFGRTKKINYGCKLVDDNGNKFSTYNIGGEVNKDDYVKISGKVKDHTEKLGIKFTVLNYCKLLSNVTKDVEKYNL